jgi:hypothetical protein
VHHGRGDCVIEDHHGIVGHASEQFVQRQNLRPVGILGPTSFVMNRGYGGLQLIGTDRSLREGRGNERNAFGDLRLIPKSPVLFCERDELLVGPHACRAAGVG